jgi:predicted Fe-Mo cluster-binding NifX family protein
MTKIAVSSEGPSLDDRVDPRFGRAAGFIIVDPDTMEFEYLDNGASQVMSQGAGIQAAEIVGRSGAAVVLTGYVGPKAFMALSAAGVTVGEHLENLSVREALDRYANGEVSIAREPNKAGHWK